MPLRTLRKESRKNGQRTWEAIRILGRALEVLLQLSAISLRSAAA